jgi:hypothetical protein
LTWNCRVDGGGAVAVGDDDECSNDHSYCNLLFVRPFLIIDLQNVQILLIFIIVFVFSSMNNSIMQKFN